MLPQQIGKLWVDVDDAFSILRLGGLLDALYNAATNVDHTVDKIEIIDTQPSGFTDPHPRARQQREQYAALTLGCVDDPLDFSLREITLPRSWSSR